MMTNDETERKRFSILEPMNVVLQTTIFMAICNFFTPLNCRQNRKILGMPEAPTITPFCVGDFFDMQRKSQGDFCERHRHQIMAMIRRMQDSGVLTLEGHHGGRVFGDSAHYFFAKELSSRAQRGVLWLGSALGPAFLAPALNGVLVRITGRMPNGDAAVGSGVHVLPEFVVTCAHVVRDMTLDAEITVKGVKVAVKETFAADDVDVGVVRISPAVDVACPDLAFRSATMLERVMVAGFPTVPTALGAQPTFLTGEICQIGVETMWKQRLDLFSAIARPGNSGGPVVSSEGNILGIVTQSLERDKEAVDPMRPLPFFAAVPAAQIRDSFKSLTGADLPWEDYN
ncbi:MAG: serine protease [Roseiarcus sp.]